MPKQIKVTAVQCPGRGQVLAGPCVQQQLQSAHRGERDDEPGRVARYRPRGACRQADAQDDDDEDHAAVCRVVGLVPVGIEGELHPYPPDRDEEEGKTGQRDQVRVVLERAGELVDRTGEHQVEEEFDPAGAPPLEAVAVRRPQRRRADPDQPQRSPGQSCPGAWLARCGPDGGHGRFLLKSHCGICLHVADATEGKIWANPLRVRISPALRPRGTCRIRRTTDLS